MRFSQILIHTLREDPSDAEIPSHRLLTRGGYIVKAAAGLYRYSPLKWRVIKKGFNADYGARPLRRAIERFIEDPLAEEVLRLGEGMNITLAVSVEGEIEQAEGLSFTNQEEKKEEPVAATADAQEG